MKFAMSSLNSLLKFHFRSSGERVASIEERSEPTRPDSGAGK